MPSDESLVIPKMFRPPRAVTIVRDDEELEEEGAGVEQGRRQRGLLVNKSLPPVPRAPSELFLNVPYMPRTRPARTVRQDDTWF